MATEKLQPNQVYTTGATSGHVLTYNGTNAVFSAPATAGAQMATKLITLAGGSADKTTAAFAFVVGPVMIEFIHEGSDNGNTIYSVLWANMRSFSGTKTDNVTDRSARGPGNGGFLKMAVDRTTSGTVLVIARPTSGTDVNPDASTGIASFTAYDWPNPGRLRVTAWEDTQS